MDKQSGMYELGRHDERRRIMQLIGEVRERHQAVGISESGKALDSLVILIATEPLPDYREVQEVTK
jgi:hypothetical protein